MRKSIFLQTASLILLAGLASVACDNRPVPAFQLDGGGSRESGASPGADLGGSFKPCNTNAHCAKSEYCHLDLGCVAAGGKIGQCRKRPQACDLLADPVCGCDGKTHGNLCAAHGAGSNVAYRGKCQTCSELSAAFSKAVLQAKKCCISCSKPQCTEKVKTNLICPCYTYIDTANSAALAAMQLALASWTVQQCKTMDCGMSCGPDPKGASCSPTPAMGTCKNRL